MGTHHHFFVAANQIRKGLFLVTNGDGQIAEHGLHVVDTGDTPAVLCPIGEIGVIMGGAGPDNAAVFGLVGICRLVLLIAFQHHLCDLAVGLEHELIHTGGGHELIFPLKSQSGAADLGIIGAVHIPLFNHAVGALVVHFGIFPESVPVPLDIELLLQKGDAFFQILHRIGLHFRLIHPLWRGDLEGGQVFEVACNDVGLGNGAVAGHGAGEVALAYAGIVVHNGAAAFCSRFRADIGGQTQMLHGVDVVHAGVLIHL